MYGFRSLTENRVLMGIGLAVLIVVMGIGTYVMMYEPSGGLSVHVGSAPKSPGDSATQAGGMTSTASPTTSAASSPASPAGGGGSSPPSPAVPPRSSISIKVQSSGGTQAQVDDMLRRAQQLGYNAMPADVVGKTVNGVVIRHKPGLSATALRVSSELAPSATLEEHADISVDVVIAVGKS